MRREPLLLPGLCLSAGILVQHLLFAGQVSVNQWLGWLLLGCGSAGWLLARWFLRRRLLALCCVLAAAFGAGVATEGLHHTFWKPKLNADDGEILIVSGCVSNPPVFSAGRAQFTVDLTSRASARVTVNLKDGESLPLRYGQIVEMSAKIRAPRNFGNPGAFNYAGYLAEQHIYWTASVAAPAEVHVSGASCGAPLLRSVYDVRTLALKRLQDLYPDDPHTAALLAATLLGETGGVEKRWTSDFRLTGTYHALVISGQHVSVLAGALLGLLWLLRVRRIPSLALAVSACWFYALVSGFSAPVVRAAGAFTLFLLASYCFRRLRVLNVLALVAIIYLLAAPHQLFDPSFQLSFLSAAAIAVFAIPFLERTTGPVREAVQRFDQPLYATRLADKAAQWRVELTLVAETVRLWTRLPEAWAAKLVVAATLLSVTVADAMIVSSCVQFGLALPMVTYFHRLSITGLTANVVVIPLLSGVVPLGFLAILTGWHPLAAVTRWLLLAAEWTATWHARFEPNYRIADLPLLIAVGFVVALLALAWSIRKAPRWTPFSLAGALALFFAICWQPWQPQLAPGKLEVTAIDVGQGDSIFVAFPNGRTMLIDAGGFPGFGNMKHKPQMDIGEDVVSPYLWCRRIRHLDIAVLSHGHSDHMGGLPAVIDNFRPQQLWIGAEPVTDEWNSVAAHARAAGTQILPLQRGSKPPLDFGGAQVRILAPAPGYVPEAAPHNNDSLVFEIVYGRQRVILTGDAEAAVEADLVADAGLKPVTLLKVGHHGSKTSSTEPFLAAVQPQYAFISDGYKNQFHHPHPTVLQRLSAHHVRVLRTDETGAETFLTDGEHVSVRAFTPVPNAPGGTVLP